MRRLLPDFGNGDAGYEVGDLFILKASGRAADN